MSASDSLNVEQFRRDAADLLDVEDVAILVAMFHERDFAKVAGQLGLTHGRTRHRTFKSVETVKNNPRLAAYYPHFMSAVYLALSR